ncbi:MAG: hypothetical protein IH948_02075 [Bacteroidetes bacterium]|nr:hypothetical protein [Bacteroidota bacterium]
MRRNGPCTWGLPAVTSEIQTGCQLATELRRLMHVLVESIAESRNDGPRIWRAAFRGVGASGAFDFNRVSTYWLNGRSGQHGCAD